MTMRSDRPKGADPVRFDSSTAFTWWGSEYLYLDHPYNTTIYNERAVEVPIARGFVDHWARRTPAGVEVGNVLAHYGPVSHRVIDRWEQAPGVENIDVFDLHGSFDWIVAISTLEHVRRDEPDDGVPFGAVTALAHLRALLNPGGTLLITHPFGQNPYLDGAIMSGRLNPVRSGTLLFDPDGWIPMDGVALWRPQRARTWPTAVWVAEFGYDPPRSFDTT